MNTINEITEPREDIITPLKRHLQPPRPESLRNRLFSRVRGLHRSVSAQTTRTNQHSLTPKHVRSISDTDHKSSPSISKWISDVPAVLTSSNGATPPEAANVSINILREVQTLDVDSERSMWVAVDIRPVFNVPRNYNSTWPLDITIILDNSVHVSPLAFSSACCMAAHIVKSMLCRDDRIALLCTTKPSCKATAARWPVLQELHSPYLRGTHTGFSRFLETAERAAVASSETEGQVQSSNLTFTSQVAASMLTEGLSTATLPTPPKSIILIISPTTERDAIPKQITRAHPVHFIRPSPPSVHTTTETPLIPVAADDAFAKVRSILADARLQSHSDCIHNIKINIATPSQHCFIEDTIGSTSLDVLWPSQTARVMIRLRVRPPEAPSGQHAREETNRAMWELERLLGTLQTLFVNVNVTYEYMLAPELYRTGQSRATSILPRPNPSSLWNIPAPLRPPDEIIHQQSLRDLVHKRLLSYVVGTANTPSAALQRLHQVFTGLEISNGLKAEMALSREALEYRLSAQRRIDDRSVHTGVSTPHSPGRDGSQENHAQSPSPSSPHHSNSSTTTIVHNRSGESTQLHTDTTTSNNKENEPPEETTDEARQIWKHMRQASKGDIDSPSRHVYRMPGSQHDSPGLPAPLSPVTPFDHEQKTPPLPPNFPIINSSTRQGQDLRSPQPISTTPSSTVQHSRISRVPDELTVRRMRRYKSMALRSKRSIGADTLRSLSFDEGPGWRGPWL